MHYEFGYMIVYCFVMQGSLKYKKKEKKNWLKYLKEPNRLWALLHLYETFMYRYHWTGR